jgi:hypothetical protein
MKMRFSIYVTASALLWQTSCSNSGPTFSGSPKRSYNQTAGQVFNFTSSNIVPGNVAINDGGRYTSFDLTQTEKAPFQVIQRQNKRQKYNDLHTQGHAARFSREEFQLSEAGLLDFLLVVDDSRSMDDEQNMVATGLNALISEFKDTNWQIAVISMSDPCVNATNLIKKSDLNPEKKFSAAVVKPLDRRATEQGFPMAIQALKGQCNGSVRSWIREGSSVGVMFLSDEENCGSDQGEQDRCRNIYGKNAAEMVTFLREIRPATDAKIYSIVDKDGTCKDAGGIGSMYVEAANATGGSVASICNDFTPQAGYSTFLTNVSKDVSRIVKRQFSLSSTPDMAQFNVIVDGQAVPADSVLAVKGNQVFIDPLKVKNGMKIVFEYTHDAVPMFTEVPLKVVPNTDSINVTVAGTILAQGTDYVYDPVKGVIKFTAMPPEDSKVAVDYIDNTKLLQHFAVDLTGARPETLKVIVNGVIQESAAYSFDSSGIDFSAIPTDGAVVSVAWKTDAHKNLTYNAKQNDARRPIAWVVTDKQTGAEVPAQWNGKTLTFASENVVEGRVVTMTWDFGEKSSTRTIDLPDVRIDDDLIVLADDKPGVCEVITEPTPTAPSGAVSLAEQATKAQEREKDKANDLEAMQQKNKDWKNRYRGSQIAVKCAEGKDYSKLSIAYKHEVERKNEFLVMLPKGVNPNDKNIAWNVFVDGIQIKSYVRSENIIHIDDDLLPPGVRVDVEVKIFTLVD